MTKGLVVLNARGRRPLLLLSVVILSVVVCPRANAQGDTVSLDTVVFYPVRELTYDPTAPALRNARAVNPKGFPASFYSRSNRANCTSTLIGERVLLTAAHCVGASSRIFVRAEDRTVKGDCSQSPRYLTDSIQDLALCAFEAPVLRMTPRYERVDTTLGLVNLGRLITLSGFGCSDGHSGDGVYRIGEAPVATVSAERESEIATVSEVILCFGDSGGPAFAGTNVEGGQRVQIAVNSRSDDRSVSFLVSLASEASKSFLKSWADRVGVKICGVHSEAVLCRSP